MNWLNLFMAALQTVLSAAPAVLAQHWDGTGPSGKLNNALQILKDVGVVGATLEQSVAASPAAQAPHPDLAAHANSLT